MNHWMKNGNVYQGASPGIMHYAFNPNCRPMPQNHMPMRLVHWSQMPQFMRSPYSNPQLYHQQLPFPMLPGMMPIYQPSSSISSSIMAAQLQAHSNELAVEQPPTESENNSLPHSIEETTEQNIEIPVIQQQMFGIDENLSSVNNSEDSSYIMNGMPGTNSEYTNILYNDVNGDMANILNADIVGDFTTDFSSGFTSDLSANLATNLPTELNGYSTDASPFLNDLTYLTNDPPSSAINETTECSDFPPVRVEDVTGEQVPLAEREYSPFTESPSLNDIAYEIEVETSKDAQQELYNGNISDNQSEESDDSEKSSVSNSGNNRSVTSRNKPESVPVLPFDISGENSRLNIKMGPGVQEEVVKAAKSLFSKRTRTLYHWLYPETSKTKLKATVTSAWDTLPENEKHFYMSQVLGRFGLQAGNLMINPQLDGIRGLSSDPSNDAQSGRVALQKSCGLESLETDQAVEDLFASCDDSNAWVSFPEPQRKSERKRKKKSSHTIVHQTAAEDDQSSIAKRLRSASKSDPEFEDDAELKNELDKFELYADSKTETNDDWRQPTSTKEYFEQFEG